MKHLYPDDPSKRFRAAKAPIEEKVGPSSDGEDFFAKNFGKRKGR